MLWREHCIKYYTTIQHNGKCQAGNGNEGLEILLKKTDTKLTVGFHFMHRDVLLNGNAALYKYK
jgi:hypothetical protein